MRILLFLHDIDRHAQSFLRSGNVEQSVRYEQEEGDELKARLTQFVRGVVVNEGDLGAERIHNYIITHISSSDKPLNGRTKQNDNSEND